MSDDDIEGFLEAFVASGDRPAARDVLLDMRDDRHRIAYADGWTDAEIERDR